MEEQLANIIIIIKHYGYLAPIIFLALHVVRQLFFIPVHLICLLGGLVFGSVFGSIYSLIGLTLNCALFYLVMIFFPNSMKKLKNLKLKWFGLKSFSITQIAILRLLPFVHYQLFNLVLLEKESKFLLFMRQAFYTNIPLAICYTIFGQLVRDLSWGYIVVFGCFVLLVSFHLRERTEIIPWKQFFQKA